MANTLNLGNGNWGTKENSLLGYSSERNNFKPLPFDFTRASNGTRVNKAGLIETVGNGIPRIDFLGNTEGALLLEPQRTNLITQSESFTNSYWIKSGASIQGDATTAGSELVTNGDFATDTDWTKGTGWTISGGVAISDGVASGNYLSQTSASTLVLGKTYKINFDLTYTSGAFIFCLGSSSPTLNSSGNITIGGSKEFYITISTLADQLIYFRSNNGVGSIDNVSVKEVQGFASPSADSPLGAFKLNIPTVSGYLLAQFANYSAVVGQSITASVFAKNEITNFLAFGGATVAGTDVYSIQDYGNGWFRHIVTRTFTTTATGGVQWIIGGKVGSNIIFGAQVEQGSYPTSYIKTEGSAVTRLADSCLQGGFQDKNIFGSTQGSAVFEFKWDLGAYVFDFNDALGIRIRIFRSTTSWRIRDFSGASWYFTGFTNLSNVKTKIGFKWNGTEFTAFQDGVKSSSTDSFASSMSIESITTNKLNNTSNMQFYNTALTDQELIELTQV